MSPSTRGQLLVVAAGVCWSMGGVTVRLMDAGPWEQAFWRSVFLAIAIGAFVLWRKGPRFVQAFTAMGWRGIASGICVAGASLLYFIALAEASVATVLVMMSVTPLLTALLGWAVLGERVGAMTIVSIAIAMGGIAIMVGPADAVADGWRDLFGLGVALCGAVNVIVVRGVRPGTDMIPSVAYSGLFLVVACAFVAEPAATSAKDIAISVFLAVFQVGLGLSLFVMGAVGLPAARTGLLMLTETVLAPIWAWIGVGEVPTARTLAGGAVIVGALVAHALWRVRPARRPGLAVAASREL